jgi:site-specific recombinase XerD
MLAEWADTEGDHGTGLLLTNDGRPLTRHVVARMLNRITEAAGIGHAHPHQLRHIVGPPRRSTEA